MSRAFLACLVLSTGAATAAETLDAHALLRKGIALSREASFAASVAALEQARAHGALSGPESADCAFWLATDYLAIGSTDAARRELRTLVTTSPRYELPPYTSPKVEALFRDVKAEVERAPRLKALPPRSLPDGLSLYFEPSRTGGTTYGAVYWRWQGERRYREAPLSHDGENLVATLSLDHAGTLEYYAESRAPDGAAQAGARDKPLELPVAAPLHAAPSSPSSSSHRDSIVKKWWLWTAVGAVAAAGLGVGLYFALRPQSPGTADAVLDFGIK